MVFQPQKEKICYFRVISAVFYAFEKIVFVLKHVLLQAAGESMLTIQWNIFTVNPNGKIFKSLFRQ